ncbi:MAG TPA: HAMP domain-containing sensor histidine kinase [Polyangiaceae bacterium]|nr:HAMP domain-containing sensor histidine kinase [Polyangiaceae bacterium]
MFSLPKIISQRRRTLLLMLVGVLAVVAAGIGDAQRQSERALDQMGRDHRLLALSLAALPDAQLSVAVQQLEATGQVAVLLWQARGAGFLLSSGSVLSSSELDAAFSSHAPSARLPRSLAATIGLGARTAIAGLAPRTSTGPASPQGVAVIESASAERDRARHAEWRAVLMVLVVSVLIVGFGVNALGRQRRESLLQQKLRLHRAERARDAELSRANRMATIAALASGFAHELATPLGVIVGRVEQLRTASANDAKSVRLLDAISSQTEHIERVIRGFLGLTRGDTPNLSRVAASELAGAAAALVQHRFGQTQIALSVEDRDQGASFVACNSTLFGQVLVNLLINALEASEVGGSVRLELERTQANVEFSVVDQGHGIARATIEQAMEPFFTTKATRGGTGLGLAIAKEIVSHHRGELSLVRRADHEGAAVRGTRVTVRLPIAQEVP